MAPAVPFALLGVVQLTAVAVWLGLAGAVSFPRLRRRVTPLFVLGALAMAAADAYTAARIGPSSSDLVGWLRVLGLGSLALGVAGGSGQSLVLTGGPGAVVVPLGARMTPALAAGVAGVLAASGAWWRTRRPNADRALAVLLAIGFVLSGAAAVLAVWAKDSETGAITVLVVRGVGTVVLAAALVRLARLLLVGKIVGAIVAGVVTMAVAAVGVVGTSVASQVQDDQSSRLLQIARSEQFQLQNVASRAGLFAQVVAQCPVPGQQERCEAFLGLFSDQPVHLAAVFRPGKAPLPVPKDQTVVGRAALVQLAGTDVVQAVARGSANPKQSSGYGAVLLAGDPPRLAVIATAPGRKDGRTDNFLKADFAGVYGVVIEENYLAAHAKAGYDVTIVADGEVLGSSLDAGDRRTVLAETNAAGVERADPSVEQVVPAEGENPTVALVPITAADNDDVRIATMAVSQPANVALSAQRAVLQRLFLTALIALLVVAALAIVLAHRIADPVRRLTVAAGRVRRGDLEARTAVDSPDEVGRLSRAFDAMTDSLQRATDDLRRTAATETELRARLETVVASMSDGLVVTDAAGLVTVANPVALELLALTTEEVVGRQLGDILDVRDAEGRAIAAARRRGIVDGELVRTDDERVPIRLGSAPLGDGQGRVIVLADRRREHEIERMKTEFLSNISHELRTPLTPIRGYAEILAKRPQLARPQVEAFLDEILSSTARMSRAVELLVDVAALEGGRVEPDRTRVTVRSFADERVEAWKTRYPERAGDFKRRVATKLPAVDIDRRWVGRALDEFADNAVKYTDPGSAITLVASLAEDGDGVRIAVRDAGAGFDPQRAAELVGDFSQADASETRRVGGLGLGLGFVSRVATRFGLPLSVETEPGKGSEFALVLPEATGR
jgi:signal transduction histidine kinase